MNQISKRDFEIILTFALHVAKVDMEFDIYERKILRHLVEVMGLTDEMKHHELSGQTFLNEELEEISSQEARVLLVMTMCAVAFANGTIHETEAEFINKVNARLGHPVELKPWEQWSAYEPEVISRLTSS